MPVKKKKAIKKATVKKASRHDRLKIIFDYSPIALWEEDFSALKRLRDHIRKEKVTNIRAYLRGHRKLVVETFRKIKIVDVNRAAITLFGAKTKKELLKNIGKSVTKETFNVLVNEFASLIEGKEQFEAEFKSKMLSGQLCDVRLRVAVPKVHKEDFKRVIVSLQNISIQKKYERSLKRMAQTDGLTGVLNHTAIRYRLEEEFIRAKRYKINLSVMMLDMDYFKKVNDKYGHQKGDQIVRKAAQVIVEHLREVDIVGRYGGDEFLAILPETSAKNARVAAERLRKIFAERSKKKNDRNILCTLSIGIAGRKAEGINKTIDLIEKADNALYKAKEAGRNCVYIIGE